MDNPRQVSRLNLMVATGQQQWKEGDKLLLVCECVVNQPARTNTHKCWVEDAESVVRSCPHNTSVCSHLAKTKRKSQDSERVILIQSAGIIQAARFVHIAARMASRRSRR